MERIRFTKMHGLANDYVVVDGRELAGRGLAELAAGVCDRRLGIGADGLLVVSPTADAAGGAAIQMRILNADGSEAEMCGNGLRCAVRFALESGMAPPGELIVATRAGDLCCRATATAGVTCDLGPARSPIATRQTAVGVATCVDLGNPHAVLFVDPEELDGVAVATLGPSLSGDAAFPRGTNVEWVALLGPDHLAQRTWERGVGETPACGTGAAAAVLAAHHLEMVGTSVRVALRGGDLVVELVPGGAALHAWQSGPAEIVFTGVWPA